MIVQSPKRFTESELMRQRLFEHLKEIKPEDLKRDELESRAKIVTRRTVFAIEQSKQFRSRVIALRQWKRQVQNYTNKMGSPPRHSFFVPKSK